MSNIDRYIYISWITKVIEKSINTKNIRQNQRYLDYMNYQESNKEL